MKIRILLFLIITISMQVNLAQTSGVNHDSYQKGIGEMPYEMAGRVEERTPMVSFDDATKWIVTSKNCDARLYRTQEQRVFRNYSGKIIYKTTDKRAEFTVKLKDPVLLEKDWDCINFWNYGDRWLWEKNAAGAMNIYVLIKDAGGEEHSMKMVQSGNGGMVYKYWFMNHLKLREEIDGPARFVGFAFKTNRADPGTEHTIFLESVYVYKEELKPMVFKELPEDMPFPLRKQTILPVNKVKNYRNSLKKEGNRYVFSYKADDAELTYELNPKGYLNDLTVQLKGHKKTGITNNSEIVFAAEGDVVWEITDQQIKNDTLFIDYWAKGKDFQQKFETWYTIKQKSLVCTINEKGKTGLVSEIKLGTTDAGSDARVVPVPVLNFNYKERPDLLYSDGLFYFEMFDWYYTSASSFYAGRNRIKKGQARYNGGVKYIPLLNGKRNLLREKLFINVSPDVQEVFPVIDNPASTKRSLQADRLWAVNGGTDLDELGKFVTGLRTKGVEKVTIRYHEGFWRKGGESYTFKLVPNPDLGVKRIKDYVAFVKSNGWNVGLYSNYTDLSPVNSNWNEDWVKRGPKGVWEVSWARNYSPKPQIAWEQEAYFAPRIQKMFNTNHSYCDVHTAVSPMSRVDFDPRTPGAGTFRHVFNCYGLLLMNESKIYGTVYSEGGNHWWYAGLLDGNYANAYLEELPVFPDFQLLQVHTKEMDAGNTHDKDSYLAYTLAHGNIGLLSEGLDAVKRYAMLQPLQNEYVMIPVKKIEYFDGGKGYNSSYAVKKDLIRAPKLFLEYKTGLQVYINFSDKIWKVRLSNKNYELPKYGVLAYMPGSDLFSFSGINKESSESLKMDLMISDELCYLDTYGGKVTDGPLRGQGSYMLKKEKTGWEIIPLGDVRLIDFEKELLHLPDKKLILQGMNENGDILYTFTVDKNLKSLRISPKKAIYKYKITQE